MPLFVHVQARTIAGIAEQVAGSDQSAGSSSPSRRGSADGASPETGPIPASHDEAALIGGVPASYSQEMLIFNNELDPFNPAHNEPFWVKINGALNSEALLVLSVPFCFGCMSVQPPPPPPPRMPFFKNLACGQGHGGKFRVRVQLCPDICTSWLYNSCVHLRCGAHVMHDSMAQ